MPRAVAATTKRAAIAPDALLLPEKAQHRVNLFLRVGNQDVSIVKARQAPFAFAEELGTVANQNEKWVADALRRMQSIKVGMTRADLLRVFQNAGGAYAVPPEVFSYRDCHYFKMTVTFNDKRGRPKQDRDGRPSSPTAPDDVIATLSKPYIEDVYYD